MSGRTRVAGWVRALGCWRNLPFTVLVVLALLSLGARVALLWR